MANRAYLFSSETEEHLLEMGDEYYDSRWNIPLLWFLLFNESSLVMPEREDILETFLMEKKDVAIERFQNTISRKKSSVLDVSAVDIKEFIENLKRWTGERLILDPMEIIQGEGENPDSETIRDFSKALNFLSNGEVDEYIEIFKKYAGKKYAGNFDEINNQNQQAIQNYLIGFTYW